MSTKTYTSDLMDSKAAAKMVQKRRRPKPPERVGIGDEALWNLRGGL